jgi:hypothetical protein
MTDRSSCRALPGVLFGLAFGLLAAGCAGPSAQLTVRSIDKRQTFEQRFDSAYAGKDEMGDYDVVLAKDTGGVRHLVHVRVLWKPMKGTKLDHPSATNSIIDWVVWDDSHGPDGGYIAYTGAGFVDLQRSGNTAKLDIRNATLSPTARHGSINDPVGRTKVSGTIVARANRDRVNTLLSQMPNTSAAAQAAGPVRPPQTGSPSASSRAPIE